MSEKANLFESLKDNTLSFSVGAIPAFLGTGFTAICYSLAHGLATAIGMSGGLSVAAGVLGAVFSAGTAVGIGALAVVGGVLSIERKRLKGPAFKVGLLAGVAASVALAFNLTAAEPEKNVPVEAEPVEAALQLDKSDDVLSAQFKDAGIEVASLKAAPSDLTLKSKNVPTLKMAA